MELLSAEASKMESWSSGTIPNFAPSFKGILPTQKRKYCIWAKFVAKPSKYIFQFHFELHAWK